MLIRVCDQCRAPIKSGRFCSDRCRGDYWADVRTISAAKRADMKAFRAANPHHCWECDKPVKVWGDGNLPHYCSTACRMRAYRRRKRAGSSVEEDRYDRIDWLRQNGRWPWPRS